MRFPGYGFLDKIIGSESAGPLADPEQAFQPTGLLGKFGGREGLLNFGLSMMANSGPSPQRRGFGEIFANSYLQSQQLAQQRAADKIRQEYMQAQIERMRQPEPQAPKRIVTGPDGRPYYEDGSPILPNVAAPKKPAQTREINKGGQVVTQEFDDAAGQWRDIASAPRWQPQQQGPNVGIQSTGTGINPATGKNEQYALLKDGTVRWLGVEAPGISGRPMPMGLADDLKANAQVRSLIRGVLPKFETAEGKDAVGWRNAAIDMLTPDGISENIKNLFDPDGTDVRSGITNLNSYIVKQRNGAAVTVAEFARQRGYLPSDKDGPEAIVTKLKNLDKALEDENVFIADFAQSQGYRVPPMQNRERGASGGWDAPATNDGWSVRPK